MILLILLTWILQKANCVSPESTPPSSPISTVSQDSNVEECLIPLQQSVDCVFTENDLTRQGPVPTYVTSFSPFQGNYIFEYALNLFQSSSSIPVNTTTGLPSNITINIPEECLNDQQIMDVGIPSPPLLINEHLISAFSSMYNGFYNLYINHNATQHFINLASSSYLFFRGNAFLIRNYPLYDTNIHNIIHLRRPFSGHIMTRVNDTIMNRVIYYSRLNPRLSRPFFIFNVVTVSYYMNLELDMLITIFGK